MADVIVDPGDIRIEEGDVYIEGVMPALGGVCEFGEVIINNREKIDIEVPGAATGILLQGDDLQILEPEAARKYVSRRLTLEAEYDSPLGDNLPLTGEMTFKIGNLSYIG